MRLQRVVTLLGSFVSFSVHLHSLSARFRLTCASLFLPAHALHSVGYLRQVHGAGLDNVTFPYYRTERIVVDIGRKKTNFRSDVIRSTTVVVATRVGAFLEEV